ncbi:MAG: hypothetical protein IJI47_00835 [Eubacterium sp.]|nr:hypothetical protein [Eubacterium sp.]
MRSFSHTIKKYLNMVGREATVIRANGGEDKFFAVVEQTWKRNKTNFEDRAVKPGRIYNEYCEILCPFDINLKQYGKGDTFVIEGEKYELCRAEQVTAYGNIQFYRGIIKKIREVDENVFVSTG